jgi:parvulin-like peptidyl-prolyl isomerase
LALAKKKVEKPKRELTKRQLSRWQQQERRRRIILGSGIAIIVAVLGVIGGGVYNQWYIPQYKPLHEIVIEVNDTKFNMDYYIKRLENVALQYESYYKPYGISVTTDTKMMSYLADEVVKEIEQYELIRQEALKLGISVSDEEVDKGLKSSALPLNEGYRDAVRTQLLVNRLRDEYFDKQVPTYAEQRHIWAMFLESESRVNEIRAKLEAGGDFVKLAGELSLDTTSKTKEGDFGWCPKGVLVLRSEPSLIDEYAFSAEAGALSQPIYDETRTKLVGYWLIKVLSRDEEAKTAQVKVMLLGSEQEAGEVRARLEAGEDFATLAKELSRHDDSKENGGDLAMSSQDTFNSIFMDFVFKSELDTLSQPIRDDSVSTKGGYWLVKVTEIDNNRQIADDDRELFKSDALNKWVEGLLNKPENKIVSHIDEGKKLWAITRVTGGLSQ